jgi:hypothetical protein
MGQCYASKQQWPQAIEEFQWAGNHGATSAISFLGYALARAGRAEEARHILADLKAGGHYSHGAFGVAVVYTGLRDYDAAFAWLTKAAEENSITSYIMLPMFRDLQRDPRFANIRRLMATPIKL